MALWSRLLRVLRVSSPTRWRNGGRSRDHRDRGGPQLHPVHTSRGLGEIGASASGQAHHRRLTRIWSSEHDPGVSTGAVGAGRHGPPTVAHIRDWAPETRLSRFVFGLVGRRADVVVANSSVVASQFKGAALRRPVRVIHNPIDLVRFASAAADGPAVRRALRIAPRSVVLTVVGPLAPLKGQDDAIETFADLLSSGCDADLLLVGSAKFSAAGTQLDNVGFARALHSLAAERGIGERVRFLGERADVADLLLAATDLLLMPFWREGFGRVAVEAMAMGVPVAAAAIGGPLDIVRDGVDGLLLPPRQPHAWSRELLPLVQSRKLREELGVHRPERARDFDIERNVDAMLSLYRELLAVEGPRAPL